MERPHCWPEGPCPNDCAAQYYRRVIFNETPLYGPWAGWRMAGARLVSPAGEWIGPAELDRVLYVLKSGRREQKRVSVGAGAPTALARLPPHAGDLDVDGHFDHAINGADRANNHKHLKRPRFKRANKGSAHVSPTMAANTARCSG